MDPGFHGRSLKVWRGAPLGTPGSFHRAGRTARLRPCPASLTRRRSAILVLALLALLVASVVVEAQFRRRGGGFQRGFGVRVAKPEDFVGGFQFCRVAFNSDFRGDGGNWSVDYPRADINLSIRLAELTKSYVSMDSGGEPIPLLIRLTDDVMFECPFIMMTEVGSAAISDEEAARLRLYLEKGGFLWADDFWGSYAWDWWVGAIQQGAAASRVSDRRPPGRIIRCSRRSSRFQRCRRSPRSDTGPAPAAGRRSDSRTAPSPTREPCSTSTATSWC